MEMAYFKDRDIDNIDEDQTESHYIQEDGGFIEIPGWTKHKPENNQPYPQENRNND